MFAKSAITGAALLNSGSLIAVLTQLSDLKPLILAYSLSYAFKCWSFGLAIATFAWVFAALAASAYANHLRRWEIFVGVLGYLCVIISIIAFIFGALEMSAGISAI